MSTSLGVIREQALPVPVLQEVSGVSRGRDRDTDSPAKLLCLFVPHLTDERVGSDSLHLEVEASRENQVTHGQFDAFLYRLHV